MKKATLSYGSGSALELELAANVLVAQADLPDGTPVEDVSASVVTALEQPLEFPPLGQAMAPGDRIAITVDMALPKPVELVRGVVTSLLAQGVEASDIAVVFPSYIDDVDRQDVRERLKQSLDDGVRLVAHNPEDATQLCYVGASNQQRAIYINREIFDADLVMPIGCLRAAQARDYLGVHGNLFPAFSDTQTIQRFSETMELASRRDTLQAEVEEAAWLLGILFTIQVIPGGRGEILEVLAGDARSVAEHGAQSFARAWRFRLPAQADLVVASLAGATEQNWQNVVRALAAACQAVEDNGAIVLCTEIAEPPGEVANVGGVAADTNESSESASGERDARSEMPSQAGSTERQLVMSEVARARSRGAVFLLSRLDDDVVEELGLAPVADASEIRRLAAQHQSCILLGHAQHRVPEVSVEIGK